MKLVDDARNAWSWFSVQAMTAAGAIQGAWIYIPEDLKASVPKNVVQWATLGLLVFGICGRMVKQDANKNN